MPSSERNRSWLAWPIVVINVLLGLGLVAASFIPAEGDYGWRGHSLIALAGLALLSFAFGIHEMLLARPRRPVDIAMGQLDSQPAVVIGYSVRLMLCYAVSCTLLAVFCAIAAWSVGGDSTAGAVFLVIPAILFASFVPDAIRVVLSKPRLAISPESITLRSWALDSRLDWDDVIDISEAMERNRWLGVISGVTGAASWRTQRRSLIWPMELKAKQPRLEIQMADVGADFSSVLRLLSFYQAFPDSRRELAAQAGIDRLLDLKRSV